MCSSLQEDTLVLWQIVLKFHWARDTSQMIPAFSYFFICKMFSYLSLFSPPQESRFPLSIFPLLVGTPFPVPPFVAALFATRHEAWLVDNDQTESLICSWTAFFVYLVTFVNMCTSLQEEKLGLWQIAFKFHWAHEIFFHLFSACTPNCKDCKTGSCSVCKRGYALFKARCIRRCPKGYQTKVNPMDGKKCVKCKYHPSPFKTYHLRTRPHHTIWDPVHNIPSKMTSAPYHLRLRTHYTIWDPVYSISSKSTSVPYHLRCWHLWHDIPFKIIAHHAI